MKIKKTIVFCLSLAFLFNVNAQENAIEKSNEQEKNSANKVKDNLNKIVFFSKTGRLA